MVAKTTMITMSSWSSYLRIIVTGRGRVFKALKPFLVGRNVDEIEEIWQSSYVSSYWRDGLS
jgi:L-alanine-DL-glutamate epimerase-like enolase superfamily enzyme